MSIDEEQSLLNQQQPETTGDVISDIKAKILTNGDTHGYVEVDGPDTSTSINGEINEQVAAVHSKLEEVEELFQKTAKSFLTVHREEVAGRDSEIEKLKAELLCAKEALKTLEESKIPGETKRDDVQAESQLDATPAAVIDVADADLTLGQDKLSKTEQSEAGLNLLVQDDAAKAVDDVQSIWECCLGAVKHIMDEDLSPDYISSWGSINSAEFEDKIPKISSISVPSLNTTGAKHIRTMIIMALLAQSLEEHVLTPNYLLEDDDELRYILRSMTDQKKKNSLRSLLFSVSEEGNRSEGVKAKRTSATVIDALQPLSTLLPAEMLDKLKAELEAEVQKSIHIWEPLQRYESHYEVNTVANRTPWDWKSVHFEEGSFVLKDVHSNAFESDEAALVVFPRVCAIDRSKKPSYTPIFPGMVVQRSQIEAARNQLDNNNDTEAPVEEPRAGDAEDSPDTTSEAVTPDTTEVHTSDESNTSDDVKDSEAKDVHDGETQDAQEDEESAA